MEIRSKRLLRFLDLPLRGLVLLALGLGCGKIRFATSGASKQSSPPASAEANANVETQSAGAATTVSAVVPDKSSGTPTALPTATPTVTPTVTPTAGFGSYYIGIRDRSQNQPPYGDGWVCARGSFTLDSNGDVRSQADQNVLIEVVKTCGCGEYDINLTIGGQPLPGQPIVMTSNSGDFRYYPFTIKKDDVIHGSFYFASPGGGCEVGWTGVFDSTSKYNGAALGIPNHYVMALPARAAYCVPTVQVPITDACTVSSANILSCNSSFASYCTAAGYASADSVMPANNGADAVFVGSNPSVNVSAHAADYKLNLSNLVLNCNAQ